MNIERPRSLKDWWLSGEPFVWLNAAAVSISIIAVVGLLLVLLVQGFANFWPGRIMQAQYSYPESPAITVVGQVRRQQLVAREQLPASVVALHGDGDWLEQLLLQVGNRDISTVDFRWLLQPFLSEVQFPAELMVVERREWGILYGYFAQLRPRQKPAAQASTDPLLPTDSWPQFQQRINRVNRIQKKIRHLEKTQLAAVNYQLEKLRLKQRGIELGQYQSHELPELRRHIALERKRLDKRYDELLAELVQLHDEADRDVYDVVLGNGDRVTLPLQQVVRAYRPNQLSAAGKLQVYGQTLWEFVSSEPREANTEGGIFPAIFGTVLMVLLMSVLVAPLGILAAVYLREYARQGLMTRTLRIAVNNLAGVPSIVYGVFGLGFFVYTLGGSIDQVFYREGLPAPTFGTPGLFWASLTLALLTLPVVIVATEEGLARVPRSLREGSLALGATRLQTITRVVLPTASPALMTGLILAVARAAGEVAPLMLVGVVKLAPTLPVDGNFPFIHLERKFMHLGFHIYDLGFQSPNAEAARPLVFATALLLVAVIIVLNLSAIRIRNRLREKFKTLDM
jgi:phosphate transport system permease protein